MTSPLGHADPTELWSRLNAAFDACQRDGRIAEFWLRDDDACRAGPLLERLVSILDGTPAGLAVIPALAEPSLFALLQGVDGIHVLPHGYAHTNHAPTGEKKAEFGAHRPLREMLEEIEAGWTRVSADVPAKAVPIFVPPWNRIDPQLVEHLPSVGLKRVSIYGSANDGAPFYLNTHVDIIDWHGTRGFVGEASAIIGILSHLDQQVTGVVPAPTGILCHHRDHDAGCWRFLETITKLVKAHPAARWIAPAVSDEPDDKTL